MRNSYDLKLSTLEENLRKESGVKKAGLGTEGQAHTPEGGARRLLETKCR